MKHFITLLLAAMASLLATAQELPQFTFNDYDGWTYSGGAITDDSFSRGIALYLTSEGNVLTLSSPVFSCQGMDSIAVVVRWMSSDTEVGVTVTIDNGQGIPIDSVRCLPATSTTSQKLECSLPVPRGSQATAQLRLTSPEANVSNCGFVRRVELSPIVASTPGGDEPIAGDADGDGKVDIADVSALIDMLLNGTGNYPPGADVDQDGTMSISDVSMLIDRLLSSN